MHRADALDADGVAAMLEKLAAAPIEHHPVVDLLTGALARRHQLCLADALYVELAASRSLPLVTTDARLRPVPVADIVIARS